MKKILVLVILSAVMIQAQDELSSLDRMKVLKMFPPTAEENLEVREYDQVIKHNGDVFRCTVVGVEPGGVMIRQEGLKILVPMGDIRRVLLSRTLFDVYNTRYSKIGKVDFPSKHKLMVEAFDHIGEDQRFYDWCLEILKVCAKQGRYVPSYIKVGDIYSAENNYSVAELYFSKAAELDGESYEALSKYAVNLKKQSKYYDAEKWFRKAIELKPSEIAVLEGLAYSLLKLGKLRDAEDFYLKALEVEPDNGAVMAGYALILAYSDRPREAREYLRRVFEKEIFTFEAYTALGMIDYRFGKHNEAQTAFTKALAVSEKAEEPEVYAFLSVINTLNGKLEENETIFTSLQTEEILTQPEVANAFGFYLLNKGDMLLKQGKKAEAEQEFVKAGDTFLKGISSLEENYYGLYGIAMSHLRRGNERDYIKYFNKAYEANPDWLYSKLMLANAFMNSEKYTETLREINMIFMNNVEQLKTDLERRAGQGSTEEDRKDLWAVKAQSRKLLEYIYLSKVRTQIHLGKYQEALQTGKELAALLPKTVKVYDYLGYIAFSLQNMDDSKEYFKTGKDLGSLYSRKRYAELLVAQNQIEYLDDFDRDDNTTLRNNWDEEETAGVEISIKDKKALLQGVITRDWDQTSFSKSYRASTFISMSVDLEFAEPDPAFYTGVYILGRGTSKGIFLIRNDKGEICYASSDLQGKETEWEWISAGKWPEGESFTIAISQTDPQMRKFDLKINDTTVTQIASGSLVKEEYYKIGCFIQGKKDSEIYVLYNDFRVISQKIE